MYIYDHKFSGAQSLLKKQPITSRPAQRNSYYPDLGISGFGGRRGSSGSYVWANGGLGQLSNEKSLRPYLSKTDDCPGYEPGEESASKKHPGVLGMPVVVLKPDTLLVADFGVNWRHVKAATKRDPALLSWLKLAKSDPSATFEVLGYSDCIAPPAYNDFLRIGRAREVAALVGPRATSVKMAPRGTYVATNLTRVGRAMNRGATIRVIHLAPKWQPPAFVRPESVVEMQEMLDDAENMLVDPVFLDLPVRRRLYGPGPVPKDWKPDVAGALQRIDASLDFVKPLVEPANIASHGRDDMYATVAGLFHTTDWLKVAAMSYAEVRRLRDQISSGRGTPAILDLAIKAKSLLAFRAAEKLKVLADEGLSFELELGSSSRPAPSYRSTMRTQLPGGATLSKRELRVLAWLRDNKAAILEAERTFRVDRRAIAAVIAWEAMHNIMRAGLRGVGPGKMHAYARQLAAVIPFLPKGHAIPQQVEARGLVPVPKSDDERRIRMATLPGALTYIAAGMRAAIGIAAAHGFNISHDLAALTSFYQGYDLPDWEKHIKKKKQQGSTTFVAADPIPVWTMSHIAYLESVLGPPTP
jgi:hypothetical protein